MDEVLNQIFNEDCLVGMNRIPDKSVDCIICDLPFGKLNNSKDIKWDNIIPMNELWKQYDRIAKENAAILLFCVEPFTSYLVMSNLKNYRQKLIWLKHNPSNIFNAKKQFMNWTEDILVFYRKLPTFNPQMVYKNQPAKKPSVSKIHDEEKGVYGKNGRKTGYICNNNGFVYPKSVLEFENPAGYANEDRKEFYHPTQKPVDLIRYLIRTYSNKGDIILDNCMGSGTSAIAAMRENRNYIGFELDPGFYETCIRRIEAEKENQEIEKRNTENQLF